MFNTVFSTAHNQRALELLLHNSTPVQPYGPPDAEYWQTLPLLVVKVVGYKGGYKGMACQ